MKKLLALLFLLVAMLAVTACDGGSTLALKSAPTKTEYYIGQQLDLSGGVLVFNDKNGSREVQMTDQTVEIVSSFDPYTSGDQTVTLKCDRQMVSFVVTVLPDAPQTIAAKSGSYVTEYQLNDTLNLTQGTLILNYARGEQGEISFAAASVTHVAGFDSTVLGTQQVYIGYGAFNALITINVKLPTILQEILDLTNAAYADYAAFNDTYTKSYIHFMAGYLVLDDKARELLSGSDEDLIEVFEEYELSDDLAGGMLGEDLTLGNAYNELMQLYANIWGSWFSLNSTPLEEYILEYESFVYLLKTDSSVAIGTQAFDDGFSAVLDFFDALSSDFKLMVTEYDYDADIEQSYFLSLMSAFFKQQLPQSSWELYDIYIVVYFDMQYFQTYPEMGRDFFIEGAEYLLGYYEAMDDTTEFDRVMGERMQRLLLTYSFFKDGGMDFSALLTDVKTVMDKMLMGVESMAGMMDYTIFMAYLPKLNDAVDALLENGNDVELEFYNTVPYSRDLSFSAWHEEFNAIVGDIHNPLDAYGNNKAHIPEDSALVEEGGFYWQFIDIASKWLEAGGMFLPNVWFDESDFDETQYEGDIDADLSGLLYGILQLDATDRWHFVTVAELSIYYMLGDYYYTRLNEQEFAMQTSMFDIMLYYMLYEKYQDEDSKRSFIEGYDGNSGVEWLIDCYNALTDTTTFDSLLGDVYQFFVDEYNQLIAA